MVRVRFGGSIPSVGTISYSAGVAEWLKATDL